MDLAKCVTNYLAAWEAHNDFTALNAAKVAKILPEAPIDEIQNEYNRLSGRSLWIEPLVDLFHDTLLKIVYHEATFVISTSWKDVNEWLEKPYVNIQIGFDDKYIVQNYNGNVIIGDDGVSTYTLVNDSFSKNFKNEILKYILLTDRIIQPMTDACDDCIGIGINVQVNPKDNQLQIVGISNLNDSEDYIYFFKNGPDGEIQFKNWSSLPDVKTTWVKALIIENEDFYIVRKMISGLRDSTYAIVDPQGEAIELDEVEQLKDLANQEKRVQLVEMFGEVTVSDLELEDPDILEYPLEEIQDIISERPPIYQG